MQRTRRNRSVPIEHRVDNLLDLAKLAHRKLLLGKHHSPGVNVIRTLLQIVYSTTLKTEEAEALRCTIAYIDPVRPDPDPPLRHVADHWRCISLGERIPCDPRNLAKLSKGADPATTILAVHSDNAGEPFIWGLVDQVAVHALRFLTWETDRGPGTPGSFYITANGVADVTVGLDYEILGALKQETIIEKFDNVFGEGPVRKLLGKSLEESLEHIRQTYPDVSSTDVRRWLVPDRIAVISRILLQIQSYKHGGALLITPDSTDDLNLKYRVDYDRLPDALVHRTLAGIRLEDARHDIYSHALPDGSPVSAATFTEYAQAENNWREGLAELAGCVRFVASLSKIDGLILMRPDLSLLGFGVEILGADDLDMVNVAEDEPATHLREIKANHFGTRHRSMMRYCNKHPGALGFVVSQDAFIRAITRVTNKLVMWENIRVRNEFESDRSSQEICPHCENFAKHAK
jgi:hypothetical protein